MTGGAFGFLPAHIETDSGRFYLIFEGKLLGNGGITHNNGDISDDDMNV